MRPQSCLPIRSNHTAPPQFTASLTPCLPQQTVAWDTSITVPLPNHTTNQYIPLLAPQPQLPAVHYNQLQLGNRQTIIIPPYGQHIAQGGFDPWMLHVQNPVVQQLPPALGPQGGGNPQATQAYHPDP